MEHEFTPLKLMFPNNPTLYLEQSLTVLTPARTALLPNYPNHFNPETWIPYRLADDANVQIRIYDIKGVLVRQLDLGYQPAGFYTNRGRAAYWDGRNSSGESVASGTYFYQLRARNNTALRQQIQNGVLRLFTSKFQTSTIG